MPQRFFFDTYAMLAIARGDTRFEPYLDVEPVTTWWNVMEFYFVSRRDGVERTRAEQLARRYRPRCLEPDEATCFAGAEFRLRHRYRDSSGRMKRVSYADALGYHCALAERVPFLTGDRGFRGLPGVEYVR